MVLSSLVYGSDVYSKPFNVYNYSKLNKYGESEERKGWFRDRK